MRRALLTAAAAAPLLALLGGAAWAACPASNAQTNGSDIELTSGCTVNVGSGQTGVTINSNNNVTIDIGATVSNTDENNSTGIAALAGNTGNLTNDGVISLSSSYSPSIEGDTGLDGGPFTTGQGRIGMLVSGPGVFTGEITNSGSASIAVQANTLSSTITGGIEVLSGVTGDVVDDGTVTVTGNHTVGVLIAGAVSGNVTADGAISVVGAGSQGLVTSAPIGGAVVIGADVSTTAYRTTTAPTGTLLAILGSDQVEQSGSAVVIGGSVAGGVTLSAAITTGSGSTATTTAAAAITQFGSAPAMVIGAQSQAITLGNTAADAHGLVIGGDVTADGVYSPKSTASVKAPIPATAIEIGGQSGGTVDLSGGIHVTGAVEAASIDATATAISIGAGTTAQGIVNDGVISATESGSTAQSVGAIIITSGANVGSITNTGSIAAEMESTKALTGNQTGSAAAAIVDGSGTLTQITNSGTITAELVPSSVTFSLAGPRTAIDVSQATSGVTITQLPSTTFGGVAGPQFTGSISGTTLTVTSVASGNIIAGETLYGAGLTSATVIEAEDTGVGGTGTYTINNSQTVKSEALSGEGPVPSIIGDILFGQATAAQHNALNIQAGNVTGAVSEYVDPTTGVMNRFLDIDVATVSGSTADVDITGYPTGNTGAVAQSHQVTSIDVGSGGILEGAVDPSFAIGATNAQGQSTTTPVFDTTVHAGQTGPDGTATFADGAQIGVTLDAVQTAQSAQYIFVQTSGAPGALTVGNLSNAALAQAPYLYTAVSSSDAANLYVTVTLKTPQQLGLNASGSAAFDAVFQALTKNPEIGGAVIKPTTEAGFINLYYQMVPDQGIGTFEALESATQKIANLTEQTPDAGTRIAGTSAWLQEVNTTIKRNDGETLGETDKLFGLVGGWEHMGRAGGALGLTLAYLNIGANDVFQPAQATGVVTNLAELGAYYRRAWGGLRFSVRGAGGYAWFSEDRMFVTTGVSETSKGQWGGYFADAHAGLQYEQHLGRYYLRPEVGFDYLYLSEDAHAETGAGPGFDLTVDQQTSDRGTGYAILTAGAQYGHDIWFRPEYYGGYREVAFGQIASTTAQFAGGGLPFTLDPGDTTGGWVVAGFSLKAGTSLSYVAIEGEADLRQDEQRYDVFLSGRAMF